MSASNAYTAEQCKKGTIHATSVEDKIFLDDVSFTLDAFSAELLRRYKTKAFYCVEIVGPGGDSKTVSSLLRKLKGSEITSINWKKPSPAK